MRRRHNSLVVTQLEEAIMNAVYEEARYGLEIIEMISEASNGSFQINFSSLYPTLGKLTKRGFLKSVQVQEDPEKRGNRLKKYYALTPLGITSLEESERLISILRNWNSQH